MELVRGKPKIINILFGVPKDKGEKQRFILEDRRAKCHFIATRYPEFCHSGLFRQLEEAEKKDVRERAGLQKFLPSLAPI